MISACLLGENCKYNGGNNRNEKVMQLAADSENTSIPICPEVLGGLPIPRTPSEIQPDGEVYMKDGKKVTREFHEGARKCLEMAQKEKPDLIVLQSQSPSCGVKERYDGTFTGRKIPRHGVTADLLIGNGCGRSVKMILTRQEGLRRWDFV